jgi:hypothetical protein
MRAPDHEPGRAVRHGNRLTCASCGKPIVAKRGSRRRIFCSNTCKEVARRDKLAAPTAPTRSVGISPVNSVEPPANAASDAISEGARYYPTAVARSVKNTPVKSVACKGDFGDLGSAFNLLPMVAIGLGLGASNNTVGGIDQHPGAGAIRCAIRVEFAARWRRGGLR